MSSVPGMWRIEDLSPPARIRHTAMGLFAENSFERTTVRAVATAAGVSPALVLHHFGSKDGLRQACDDMIMQLIEDETSVLRTGGSLPEINAYLAAHPETVPVMGYLTMILRTGGPLAQNIFDQLCESTGKAWDAGIEGGTMNTPTDREAAVATLVAYSCGATLLGPLLAKRLGGEDLLEPAVHTRHSLAALELLTHGMLADDTHLNAARRAASTTDPTSFPEVRQP